MPQTEFHSTVSETSPLVFGSLETDLTVAPEAVIVHSIVTLDLSSVEIMSKPSSSNYPATIQEADGQTLKALPRKNPPPYLPKTAVVPPLNPTTPPLATSLFHHLSLSLLLLSLLPPLLFVLSRLGLLAPL